MEKKIEELRWKPKWVSHMGCLKGCLDYLELKISDAWLYGATGHAFVINLHDEVCPSGPTAWDTQMLLKLGKNAGYTIDGVVAHKSQEDFSEKQQTAWENTRKAIDQDLPCYGWELDIPEYYVVYGYDDKGYYFSGAGCDDGKGPKPWQEMGNTGIGMLEMYTVRPGPAADDRTTVKEALEFALEHARSPKGWIYPRYKAGLEGYDNWISALEAGRADGQGMGYNAAVWSECRIFAVQFLLEARQHLGDSRYNALFDEAAGYYETVYRNLLKVAELFPFPPKGDEVNNARRCKKAVKRLQKARKAEESGLGLLARIVREVGSG